MERLPDGVPLPETAHRLFGERTGIVRSLHQYPPSRQYDGITITELRHTNVNKLFDVSGLEIGASGKGDTIPSSIVKGIGETVERYCQAQHPARSDLIFGSYEQLDTDGDIVPFEHLDTYTQTQREECHYFDPFSRSTEMLWTEGKNLVTGETVRVPADWAWLSTPSEKNRFLRTSNGAACSQSLKDAICRGILELLERDAFVYDWYTDKQTPILGDDVIPKCLPGNWSAAHPELEFTFFNLEPAIDVHAVGCSILRNRTPAFVVGASADSEFEEAIKEAMVEAVQTHSFAMRDVAGIDIDQIDPNTIYNLHDNVAYYADPGNAQVAHKLIDGPTQEDVRPTSEYDTTLPALIAKLNEQDLTPIALDLTTSDILQCGLTVAKVIIPELLDLCLPSCPEANHPRLKGKISTTQPHPFP